jgi:hypothetical protein
MGLKHGDAESTKHDSVCQHEFDSLDVEWLAVALTKAEARIAELESKLANDVSNHYESSDTGAREQADHDTLSNDHKRIAELERVLA